jgi:hypothetical protein
MACQYEEKLTSWLLGDLNPKEQDEITCHVFTCDSCKKECDELRRVLFPLRSGLHKDLGLFKAKRNIHWTQRLLAATWLRQAAILLISCSVVCAVMTLLYHQSRRRHGEDGPVTQITFGKMQTPPPPLEPLEMPAEKPYDPFSGLNIVEELRLAEINEVPVPPLPGGYWTPRFMTINQMAMLHTLGKGSETMHERLMRQLPEARWDLNPGSVRQPRKPRQPAVPYGPTLLASPRYGGSTNQMSGTLTP